MVWAVDQVAPWVLLTDLPPDAIGVCVGLACGCGLNWGFGR